VRMRRGQGARSRAGLGAGALVAGFAALLAASSTGSGADPMAASSTSTSTTLSPCVLLGLDAANPLCATTTTASPTPSSTSTSTTSTTTAAQATTTTAAPATTTTTTAGLGAPPGGTPLELGAGSSQAPVHVPVAPGQASGAAAAVAGAAPAAASSAAAAAAGVAIAPAAAGGVTVLAVGPRSTVELLARLALLQLDDVAIARLMAPFPLAGPASYGADGWPADQGAEIATAPGTPVVASGPGVVRVSGGAVQLATPDGTVYGYRPVASLARGLANGSRVAQGDILGTAGETLHFEIHPAGGPPVDPVPYLDRWLAQAAGTARALASSPGAATASLASLLREVSPTAARSTDRSTRYRPGDVRARFSPASRSTRRSAEPDPVPVLAVVSFGLVAAARRFQRRRKGVVGGTGEAS
jgi:murein DD-endopeptidase MepM/ murein hydrolase activator NlpD